ncbi:hypothetical protein Peur_043138 [Populus x canadensis]
MNLESSLSKLKVFYLQYCLLVLSPIIFLNHSQSFGTTNSALVMRRYGVPESYEKLKELTRGRAVTKDSIKEFTEGLELPEKAKDYLLELTSHTYVGAAIELGQTVDIAINLVNGVTTL